MLIGSIVKWWGWDDFINYTRCGSHRSPSHQSRSLESFVWGNLGPCAVKMSRFQEFKNSRIQELKNSRIQELKNSRIQELKNSRTQELKNSRIQEFKNSRIREFKNSSSQNVEQRPHKMGWNVWAESRATNETNPLFSFEVHIVSQSSLSAWFTFKAKGGGREDVRNSFLV